MSARLFPALFLLLGLLPATAADTDFWDPSDFGVCAPLVETLFSRNLQVESAASSGAQTTWWLYKTAKDGKDLDLKAGVCVVEITEKNECRMSGPACF